jgi:hypothetical protein
MKLHGAVGGVLFCILAGALGAAGCSSSSTGTGSGGSGEPTPTGCNQDNSLSCTGNAYGYACAAGDNPQNYDNLICSDPTPNGSDDDFCCFVDPGGSGLGSTTCNPDDNLTSVCTPGTYGFVCAAGDDPTTYDSTLTCSTPTPDGANDDFCCTY